MSYGLSHDTSSAGTLERVFGRVAWTIYIVVCIDREVYSHPDFERVASFSGLCGKISNIAIIIVFDYR